MNAPIPLVTLNTVGPTLVQYGTDEQKQKFLPAILDGTVEFAIGYSEPSAGSDLASLRTAAVRDGDDYIINGAKMFTSGAAYADYIWLAARTDPNVKKHKGIIDLHRADVVTGLLVEAAAHHAGRVHLLHVLRRRARACQFDRRRRERGLEADHHAAELRARGAGQHGCARAVVREDAGSGRRPPNSTADASSTSRGCSRRWPGSRRRSRPTRS